MELPGWEKPWHNLTDNLCNLYGEHVTHAKQCCDIVCGQVDHMQPHRAQWTQCPMELPGQEQPWQDFTNHPHDLCRGALPMLSDQTQGHHMQQAGCTHGAPRVGVAMARHHWHLCNLCREASPCQAIKCKEITHSGHKACTEQWQDITGTCAICAEKCHHAE
jgi:hypothetical protein